VYARAVAAVATGVHSSEAAQFLLHHISRTREGTDNLARYVHHIARYGAGEPEGQLLAFLRERTGDNAEEQVALFRALAQGTQERGAALTPAARTWVLDLARRLLSSKDSGRVVAGTELAGSVKLDVLQDSLVRLAVTARPEAERTAALNALVSIDPKGHLLLLGDLVRDPEESPAVQDHAASLLAFLNRPECREELLAVLPSAPARLQTVIATGLASSPAGAEKLLEAVASGKASARLLQERPVEVRLVGTHLPGIAERLAKLTQGLPPADQRLQDLLNRRKAGFASARSDVTLGIKVFEKNCAICHQLNGKGVKIGPQLDGIGIRGVDRLLEDVLDPSRNVDQTFRLTSLALKNGQVVQGLMLREEGAVIVLADAQGKEVRVPKDTVEERTQSQVSPMPGNFADQIPEADFYNLLAFLLTQQPTKNGAPTK
jgi:putative heme-binding domain-containing protein